MKKFIFSFSLFLMFLLWIYSVHAQSDWLLNPWFTDPALENDTGIISNQNVAESPDDWKWGYSCYKWDSGGLYPIDWCRVKSYKAGPNDYNVYIAGDSLGSDKIGIVRLVQGNYYGGSAPWYVPPKMSINSGDIYIDSWYHVISYTGLHNAFMYDIWLKDDSNGNIMVLDLIFFIYTYLPTPIKSPWWAGGIFHYQASVCGGGGWQHCNFNLNQYIDDAISKAESQGVHFSKSSTYIYQAEILSELIHAVGELDVGGFRLYQSIICNSDGILSDGLCHEECGSSPKCDSLSPGIGCCSGCYYTDVNNDGKVDIKDILSVAKTYGSRPGDFNWNPNCDVDGNGKIDIKDILSVAKMYGVTCMTTMPAPSITSSQYTHLGLIANTVVIFIAVVVIIVIIFVGFKLFARKK